MSFDVDGVMKGGDCVAFACRGFRPALFGEADIPFFTVYTYTIFMFI
jgi:hypothetical protein